MAKDQPMKLNNILHWFNHRNRQRQLRQAQLAMSGEWHLWRETPNDYREKDLGYQTICGQRVRAKRVFDTTGLSFLILDDSFKVTPNSCI